MDKSQGKKLLSEIEEKYGVDFGKGDGTTLAEHFREEGFPALANLMEKVDDSKQSSQSPAERILDKLVVFGQKQEPYNCTRCGASTNDKSQTFCWCTDRDSSGNFDSPNWIDNIRYPRYLQAKSEAKTQLRDALLERLPEKDVYLTTAEVKDIVRSFFGGSE